MHGMGHNYNFLIFRAGQLHGQFPSPVYSLTDIDIYNSFHVTNHNHWSPGGREGHVTGRRRESNQQPADYRMRDRLPRLLGHPRAHKLTQSTYKPTIVTLFRSSIEIGYRSNSGSTEALVQLNIGRKIPHIKSHGT